MQKASISDLVRRALMAIRRGPAATMASLAFACLFPGLCSIGDAAHLPFNELRRNPDRVWVTTPTNRLPMIAGLQGSWSANGITVTTEALNHGLLIELAARETPVKHLELEWTATFPPDAKFLGDAWERAYGDLEWNSLDPKRVMPWYFLISNGPVTHGYGVRTGPSALCHWTVRSNAVALHADVRSGGVGVELGTRKLAVCSIVAREGRKNETPFKAACAFCRVMCASPRLPLEPVYGFNDWYCAYGGNTAEAFLETAGYITRLAPTNNPPFALVDDGWQVKGEKGGHVPWSRTNPRFSSSLGMGEFAQRVRNLGARPGIWVRPLQAYPDQPKTWLLARDARVLDPTVPEVRAYVRDTIARLRAWDYDLIKHDFTTYEKRNPVLRIHATRNHHSRTRDRAAQGVGGRITSPTGGRAVGLDANPVARTLAWHPGHELYLVTRRLIIARLSDPIHPPPLGCVLHEATPDLCSRACADIMNFPWFDG